MLKDVSDAVNNHASGTLILPLVAAQDYIFLGADAPFNHRWIELGAVNDQASAITVAIWDGNAWIDCAEMIDLTKDSAGTKTLAASNRLIWVPDPFKTGWGRDDTKTSSGREITGLGAARIFNLFWARLKFSGDIKATTELKYLGWKFANDEDLYALYPEFDTSSARERFKTGTTTFDQMHFEAAKSLLRDLKAAQVITSENQVIEWEVMRLPAIHKAAELIYAALGSDWADERKLAIESYKRAMQVDLFNVDQDANARLDVRESSFRQGRMLR